MKKVVLFLFIVLFLSVFVYGYSGRNLTADLSFRVDPGIVVDYYKFEASSDTTSLLYFTDEQLQNVSSLTLSIQDKGKIVMLENVNLTKDMSNGVVNLSRNVNILENYVYLDSEELTSMNKPALILVKGVDYNDPVVIRDGVLCPASFCTEISYVEQDYTFRVEGFSTYYIMENPNPEPVVVPSVGGSSGGSSVTYTYTNITDNETILDDYKFYVSESELIIKSFSGEEYNNSFYIENTGEKSIEVAILTNDLNNFISGYEPLIQLAPGEKKFVNFNYVFPKKYFAGVYSGEIVLSSGHQKEIIKVLINLNKGDSLFDINLNLFEKEYSVLQKVYSKMEIDSYVEGESSVFVYYAIRDLEGNVISSNSENLNFVDNIIISRSLRIPSGTPPGEYLFYAGVNYEGTASFTSQYFEISKLTFSDVSEMEQVLVIFAILILFLIFVIVRIFYLKYKKENMALFFKKTKKKENKKNKK